MVEFFPRTGMCIPYKKKKWDEDPGWYDGKFVSRVQHGELVAEITQRKSNMNYIF